MTKLQEQITEKKIVLLTIPDVMKITGWSEQTTRQLFVHDELFPTIKIGKSYQVELEALQRYLQKRHKERRRYE